MEERYIVFVLFLVIIGVANCQDLKPGNWPACSSGKSTSKSVVDSIQNIQKLRNDMYGLDAYIIPSGDFHLSEFVSGHDERVRFISGFDGSMGTAVITKKSAALWTVGKYFLQAESKLDCNWILMREGEPGVHSIVQWLEKETRTQTKPVVGACPYFFGNEKWKKYNEALSERGITLEMKAPSLIDGIWTHNRPQFPSYPINAYPIQYSGKTWQEKIGEVQGALEAEGADVLVVTGLDEIAWLFNLRGSDIRGFVNDPFFYSFALIDRNSKTSKLYIKDPKRKLVNRPSDDESTMTVAEHLNTNGNGTCNGRRDHCVEVRVYSNDAFISDVRSTTNSQSVKRVWVSYHCNFAVYGAIPAKKVFVKNTPITMMKSMKNKKEIEGMKNANIKDTAALARFMAKLEKEVRAGIEWTELSATRELAKYRRMQAGSRGDSFTAISSVGPHAAINHYSATNVSDVPITTDETYLLDSGGQYIDGTTDVTRTFLFREPTAYEKDCYTRVLMGQINLAMAVWSKGRYGREIDAFARAPLWDVGLIYRHGTGHGIGHYLSVHEGPGRISNYHPLFDWDVPLDEHMFFSDEPGYYEDGKFGIRLENLIFVKKVKTKYTVPGATMLGMETITFFPYEPHLIDVTIMTKDQLEWLNTYNQIVLDKIGPLLKAQNDQEAWRWVHSRTSIIMGPTSGSSSLHRPSVIPVLSLVLAVICAFYTS